MAKKKHSRDDTTQSGKVWSVKLQKAYVHLIVIGDDAKTYNLFSTDSQPFEMACAWAQMATLAKTGGYKVKFNHGPEHASPNSGKFDLNWLSLEA